MKDYESGLAVPAGETGTIGPNRFHPDPIRIQLGRAVFRTRRELREWLRSARVIALLIQADWPTPETKAAWLHFVQDVIPRDAAEASVSNRKRACRHLAEKSAFRISDRPFNYC